MTDRKSIILDTCQISYFESGVTGLPVVFLHDNSLGAVTYKELFKNRFNDKFRLIAFDLPGHGSSSFSDKPNEDYSIPGLCSILKKVLTKLHAENAVLVGNGLGGHIILESINDLPWIRGVVLIDTPVFGSVQDTKEIMLNDKFYKTIFKGHLNDDDINLIAKYYIQEEFSFGIKELIKKSDYKFRKYFGAWIENGEFLNHKDILKNLQLPIAVFTGEDSYLCGSDELCKFKTPNLWRNAKQTLSSSSHMPHVENIEYFAELLKGFLRNVYED